MDKPIDIVKSVRLAEEYRDRAKRYYLDLDNAGACELAIKAAEHYSVHPQFIMDKASMIECASKYVRRTR